MHHEPHLKHKEVLEICTLVQKLSKTNPESLSSLLAYAKDLHDKHFSPELRALTRELQSDKREG